MTPEKDTQSKEYLRSKLIAKYGEGLFRYHTMFLQYVEQIRRRAGIPKWQYLSVLFSLAKRKHYFEVNQEIWVHKTMIDEVKK